MKTAITFLVLFAVADCYAQKADYSNDVSSPDAMIAALYDVISGEPGTPRDWDRFLNLFQPDARLLPTRKSPEGNLIIQPLTPAEYVKLFSSRIATGFFERELHRETAAYGTVVHAFSTYETKERKDGPVTNRGVNSIQLFYDGKRYSIVNIFWCAESLGFPLPEKYLPR